jgi:Mg-chelatase subunit ChlD
MVAVSPEVDQLSTALELTRPQCLVGLLLLAVLVFYYRRTLTDFARTQRLVSLAVRSIVLILLVLALAGLTLLRPTRQQYVVIAVDQSLSISGQARKDAEQWVARARELKGSNRLSVIYFAADVADGENPVDDQATNLSRAMEMAAASVMPSYVPHIVLLTDGNETAGDALRTGLNLGVRVSAVPMKTRDDPEVQVTCVDAPPRVREGEPFYLDVLIDSNHEDDGYVEVYRGAHQVARQKMKLKDGENRLRLRQSITKQRVGDFSVRISGFKDTLLDNNRHHALVFAEGKPRVLLIESQPKTAKHLAWALGEQDVQLDVRPPKGMPTSLDDMQNYELLILSNVPATSLTLKQMELARTYVQDLGGGLIMIGGDQSFGLGGYYKTVIEQILPVRSNFKKEKQKPSLAMMLVIDKSGSMGGMKIELAKDAARSAVELLGPRDQVGVLAFDGGTYVVSELHSASDKSYVIDNIASITAGGGTSMGPAMEQAYESLQSAPAKLKHVIILTDGISSPGNFEGIASNMAASRITATTVAVGQGADQGLLERIAKTGGGRFYFTDDPTSIPQIFTKETMAAGKSAINEQPFTPQLLRATPALSQIDLAAAPFLLGYVTTRPKPTSELILTAENGDPLLAWWRYGLGMTCAFTSDAKSRWAAEWVAWPSFGRFWAQLIRHIMRKSDAMGLATQVVRQGDHATVTVDAIDATSRYLNSAQIELTVVGPDMQRQKIDLNQVAPGRYEAPFNTAAPGAYHLEVTDQAHGQVRSRQSRGLVVGYPDELRIRKTNEAKLRSLTQATSGLYNPEVAQVFAAPDHTAGRATPLWPYLISAAVLLFIVDVALRRIEIRPQTGQTPAMRTAA